MKSYCGAFLVGTGRKVANRETFVLRERLPLIEADLDADAVELTADGHRDTCEAMMDLVFEFESPDHFATSLLLIFTIQEPLPTINCSTGR